MEACGRRVEGRREVLDDDGPLLEFCQRDQVDSQTPCFLASLIRSLERRGSGRICQLQTVYGVKGTVYGVRLRCAVHGLRCTVYGAFGASGYGVRITLER